MESVLYQNVQQNRKKTIFSLLTDSPIYKEGIPGDKGSVPLAPSKQLALGSVPLAPSKQLALGSVPLAQPK